MSLGLVLSGGSIRGVSHIGVLKALQEEGIKIEMISGTSAGSIIAGLYACGFYPDEMRILANNVSSRYVDIDYRGIIESLFNLLRKRPIKMSGIILGRRLENLVREVTKGAKLKDAQLPLAIIAVDINKSSIVVFTNKRQRLHRYIDYVYVEDASIAEAIRASVAIPGIFAPKIYKKMRLVDGGIRANVPVDIIRQMGAKKVLAVNLGYSGTPRPEVDNILEISLQALNIMMYHINLDNINSADLVITPEIGDYSSLTDAKKMDYLVECGYIATRKVMPQIKDLLRQI